MSSRLTLACLKAPAWRAGLVVLALALPIPAQAQQAPPSGQTQGLQPAQPTSPGIIETRPTNLLDDLKRIAESLGALHYLRPICGANEGQLWRNEMQALLEAEANTTEWREQMIGAFNRGYRAYQDMHRTCGPATQALIRRHLEDGAAVSRDAATRFGD
jgi:uncharacterized protein (TIGR02301 family)